jgi:hypothetical protein
MGGMRCAVLFPDLIDKLIIADIAQTLPATVISWYALELVDLAELKSATRCGTGKESRI